MFKRSVVEEVNSGLRTISCPGLFRPRGNGRESPGNQVGLAKTNLAAI